MVWVNVCAFLPDSQRAVAVSDDGDAKIWVPSGLDRATPSRLPALASVLCVYQSGFVVAVLVKQRVILSQWYRVTYRESGWNPSVNRDFFTGIYTTQITRKIHF
jgi:hypothetical protein